MEWNKYSHPSYATMVTNEAVIKAILKFHRYNVNEHFNIVEIPKGVKRKTKTTKEMTKNKGQIEPEADKEAIYEKSPPPEKSDGHKSIVKTNVATQTSEVIPKCKSIPPAETAPQAKLSPASTSVSESKLGYTRKSTREKKNIHTTLQQDLFDGYEEEMMPEGFHASDDSDEVYTPNKEEENSTSSSYNDDKEVGNGGSDESQLSVPDPSLLGKCNLAAEIRSDTPNLVLINRQNFNLPEDTLVCNDGLNSDATQRESIPKSNDTLASIDKSDDSQPAPVTLTPFIQEAFNHHCIFSHPMRPTLQLLECAEQQQPVFRVNDGEFKSWGITSYNKNVVDGMRSLPKFTVFLVNDCTAEGSRIILNGIEVLDITQTEVCICSCQSGEKYFFSYRRSLATLRHSIQRLA